MTFSETVNVSSFNFSGLTLVNGFSTDGNGAVSSYTLTGGTLQSGFNNRIVVLALSRHDLDAIIAVGDLATSSSTTYLAATSGTILDMVHNQLVSVPLNHPLRVSAYYGKYE